MYLWGKKPLLILWSSHLARNSTIFPYEIKHMLLARSILSKQSQATHLTSLPTIAPRSEHSEPKTSAKVGTVIVHREEVRSLALR